MLRYGRVSRKWCGARAWDRREGAVVVRPAAVVLHGNLAARLTAVDNALRSVLYSILHNCLLQWLFLLFFLLFLSLLRE